LFHKEKNPTQEIPLTTLDADDLKFAHWISNHERESQYAPARFRRSTALMAVFGYVAIWVVLLLGLAVLVWIGMRWAQGQRVGGVMIMVGIGALSLVFAVARALWTPYPPPQGRRVTRDQAPQLFKLLDKVRERTGGLVLTRC
jgi:hypothetical protein